MEISVVCSDIGLHVHEVYWLVEQKSKPLNFITASDIEQFSKFFHWQTDRHVAMGATLKFVLYPQNLTNTIFCSHFTICIVT